MKKSKSINKLFENDRFLLFFSFLLSLCVWVAVVVLASPQTTRVLKKVNVTIDQSLVSQFGLKVFSDTDFTADVTVKGKKYQISSANLTADDIIVEAIPTGVSSAGYYNLRLSAADSDSDSSYSVMEISPKTIRVYFDTEKTTEFAVEPKVETGGSPVVAEGYTYGDITTADPTVSVTGPSAQVDRIKKIVAELNLTKSLTANTSAETELVALDENGKAVTEFITLSVTKTLVNVPVFRVKTINGVVTFKNIPTNLVSNPLKYTISPAKTDFNIIVDEYDKTVESSVGVIDYKMLSPSNNVFKFDVEDTSASNPDFKEFTVKVNMDDYTQEYMTVSSANIKLNNPKKADISVLEFSKSVVIVGKENSLKQITEDMITVDVDLSLLDLEKGETAEIPAIVNVNSPDCWVYGVYTVKVRQN